MTISEALQIALQHHRAGRLAEAEGFYRQILAAQPRHADALRFLGVMAHQVGRHDRAVELLRQAVIVDPNFPATHCVLGEAYFALGRLDEAVASFGRALQLKPDFPAAHNNLGNALRGQGRLDDATAAYRRALLIKPDSPEACNNLGVALQERGQLDDAIAAYRRALDLKPDYPNVHNNLGNALGDRGELDEAVAAFQRALQLTPDDAEVLNNLGNALWQGGRPNESAAAFQRAIQLKPDYAEAFNNLGNVLKDLCRLDEALVAYRRALELKPEHISAHSNLIYALHFHPGHNARTIAEEQERWNARFGAPLKPCVRPHSNDRDPGRRLRIGYVSPDFRDHVVGRYLLPLFRGHDRGSFEIFCYAGVIRPDKLTEEFRQCARQWRDTVGLGDEALAEMIRRDGVDILVDLTQHLAGNRLRTFARQPAPVQVSFAGYPESAGLEAIEYRISDRYLEGGSAEPATGRKERVFLIDSFWCYDPCGIDVAVNGSPARESGGVTFGSMNNSCKVNERALCLWARVLGKVKDSRLVISSRRGSHRQWTLEILGRDGVEAHRVEFEEYRPRRQYLELYHRLDIVLDTHPYNGGVTTCDALWMGVPVVSLAGETPVSRAGLSLLTNLGLPELVAHSEDDYVRIASELARDLTRLEHLRSTLRQRMETSVLMDGPRFARNVEAAYRSMWRRWCEDSPPLSDVSGESDKSD